MKSDLQVYAIVALGVLASGVSLAQSSQPLNVELTTKAWDQFNKGAFEDAIKAADRCIDEFQGQADREQEKLRKANTPVPPTGKPGSEREKNTIMARGVLNDVATCFYIKGRSAENLKRTAQAKEAYRVCKGYTHALTWDAQGWFWAPAEVCSDRAAKLK